MSFTAAAARLRGLVRGSFLGIEVLARGVSPRILDAYVLGSGGRTTVSGSELAARLGLYDSWAYFTVKNGASLTPEPDRSGQQPAAAAPPAAVPVPTPAGPQGGAQAPGAPESSPAGGAGAG